MSTTGSNDSWSGTVPTYGTNNSNLRLASFQHRLGAYALDLALAFLTLGIGWFIWSLVVWSQGQTPAKKILKLRVYAADNSQRPATWGHMAVRELLLMMAIGIAAGILNLFTFIVGSIGIIAWYVMEIVWYFTKGQRTLRDTLVKTLVVNEA
jgi:uncharacterized RDD family membrane protein YckC